MSRDICLCIVAVALCVLVSSLATPSAAQTISDPSWGYSFMLPAGWKEQHASDAAILGHDRIAGMILVMPHQLADPSAMREEMSSGLIDEDVELLLTGRLRDVGKGQIAGTFEGTFRGERAKAWAIATTSGGEAGGAYILAVSTPEAFSKELSAAADAVARSLRYTKPKESGLREHFAGTWVNSTQSTETTVTLFPDGRFAENYEAGYSGTESGQWGLAREDQSGGTWSVSGTREKGNITLQYANGNRQEIEYRVHVEGGEVYWSEYWFNGSLYGKQRR